MAQPTNEHHVHADGYCSDRGEPDRGRMMRELADEIEQIDGVQSVRPFESYTEVEYRPDYSAGSRFEKITETTDSFGCDVVTISDDEGLLEVRSV